MSSNSETIAAIATASGRGGIGVVRVSGPNTIAITEQICSGLPSVRQATLAYVKDRDQKLIDKALVLFFSSPDSFTGEDVLEIHGHGGMMVMHQILNRVIELGARLAKPGEFSERAFLNDKIDLAQAEAIADLIDASSQKAVRAAARSLEGVFSDQINQLLGQMIELRMYIESAIDFPEEEIDFISEGKVKEKTKALWDKVDELINSATQGKLLRDGIIIVIAGKPNAGKSSLLNTLSGSDSAIVTEIPGTTRDVLKETINIDGLPITLVDTAGLRQSDDPVELEGIRRAKQQIENADCILNVIDISQQDAADSADHLIKHSQTIDVYNKIDLTAQSPGMESDALRTRIYLSAKTGAGVEHLREKLKHIVGYDSDNEGVFIARRRHLDALDRTKEHVNDGMNALSDRNSAELLADDLLQAQKALNEITGEFTSDDLLGKIFSQFCIGK